MIQAAGQDVISSMGWRGCALLIASAGAVGGMLNAYFSDHGLKRPTVMNGIWCPGAIGNVIVGAVSAIVSWALYGSGAGVDIANANLRELISLRLTALAGALILCWTRVSGRLFGSPSPENKRKSYNAVTHRERCWRLSLERRGFFRPHTIVTGCSVARGSKRRLELTSTGRCLAWI
jgi:hypothetical protein